MHENWPEPARALYNASRDTIHGLLEKRANDGWGVKIGDGTVLALRWKHRNSEDLDLAIAATPTKAWWNEIHEAMTRAGSDEPIGAEDGIEGNAVPKVVAYPFRTGKIDISTNPLRLPHGHSKETVGRDEVTLLSNSQILAGNYWGRGTTAPRRDLYDYAVAAEVDRDALAVAVNAQARWMTKVALDKWWDARDDDRVEPTEEITGTSDRWKTHAANPIDGAIRGVLNNLYDHLDIRMETGRVIATMKSPQTDARETIMNSHDDVDKWWNETAQHRLWLANGENPAAIRKAIDDGITKRQTHQIVKCTPDPITPPDGFDVGGGPAGPRKTPPRIAVRGEGQPVGGTRPVNTTDMTAKRNRSQR